MAARMYLGHQTSCPHKRANEGCAFLAASKRANLQFKPWSEKINYLQAPPPYHPGFTPQYSSSHPSPNHLSDTPPPPRSNPLEPSAVIR